MFWMLEQHLERHPEEKSRWPGLDMELRSSLGAGKILILMGSDGPVAGEAVFAKYFHGRLVTESPSHEQELTSDLRSDGLSNIESRHPELTPPVMEDNEYYYVSDRSLTVALPELMLDYPPSTIAYLALGPLTSLARLHAISPVTSFLHHFALILVMGGALDVPGNTTPCAEFNTYADPWAAQTVYGLSLPHLYILPLDITTPHTLPFALYTSLVDPHFADTSKPSQAAGKTPLVHFTSSFLEGTRETIRRFSTSDRMEMHDPAVVWALIDWSRDGQTIEIEHASGARGSDLRRRIEENGFSRRVLERRRSSDLRLRARLEKERERIARVVEVPHDVSEEGEYEYENFEADEQDDLRDNGSDAGEEFGWEDDERLAPGWEWVRREFEVETCVHHFITQLNVPGTDAVHVGQDRDSHARDDGGRPPSVRRRPLGASLPPDESRDGGRGSGDAPETGSSHDRRHTSRRDVRGARARGRARHQGRHRDAGGRHAPDAAARAHLGCEHWASLDDW